MMVPALCYVVAFLTFWIRNASAFDVLRDYSGTDFFTGWDFYGSWDNLTLGDVWWLNETDATAQGLAYVNSAGNAIIKVDNTSTVPFNQKRNTVRITTSDFYDYGSVWVFDALHIPYGCSVWPAFWSKGALWPNDGEIDIVEAVNVMSNNQMALHTTPGCFHNTPPGQTGASGGADCSVGAGCTVRETASNSFESGFAATGGGVWATQFDAAGIFIWFWSRPNVPASLAQANATSSLDISQWGPPSASYPTTAACNTTAFFGPQQLVIDITLCGDWAGIGPVYNATCGNSGPTGLCYPDNVVGPGSPKYDNAYFEIAYVRTYTTTAAVLPVSTSLSFSSSSSSVPSTAPSTTATTATANTTPSPTASATASAVQQSFLPAGGATQVGTASGAAQRWEYSDTAMLAVLITLGVQLL